MEEEKKIWTPSEMGKAGQKAYRERHTPEQLKAWSDLGVKAMAEARRKKAAERKALKALENQPETDLSPPQASE
ncbi:MAG: hypothetical protein WC346_01320 [Methanogenium sp.]|jgi:hypothetical protein